MVLTRTNADFIREGELSESALLQRNKPVLYESTSRISSKTYAGSVDKINKSTSIPDDFKPILTGIRCQVSLGTTKTKKNGISTVEYRNFHIYTNKAQTLDGIERMAEARKVILDVQDSIQ